MNAAMGWSGAMGCAVGRMRSRVPGNVRSGACAEGVLVAVLV